MIASQSFAGEPVCSAGVDSHLSRQSVYLDNASAPMTTMLRYRPVLMYVAADMRPMTKPLHAAVMSYAVAFLAPISVCTCRKTSLVLLN